MAEFDLKNELKRKLKNGEVALGATITMSHSDIAETLGLLGYDWILIDTEHAPLEVGQVQSILQAMSGSKSVPIVRVAWNNYQSERFVSAMDRIVRSCEKHGVVAGMLAVDDVRKRVGQGYRLLNKGGDLGFLKEAAARSLDEARKDATASAKV